MRNFIACLLLTLLLGCTCTQNEDLEEPEEKEVDRLTELQDGIQKSVDDMTKSLLKIDYEQARKSLAKFRSAANLKDKIEAASGLALANAQIENAANKNHTFTPEEVATIQQAHSFSEALLKRTEAFEANLTRDEIDFITHYNPQSIYRTTKRFFLFSMPLCTPAEYEALKAKMPADQLAKRGRLVMTLASRYEAPFEAKYAERIQELLKRPKYKDVKNELSEYYAHNAVMMKGLYDAKDIADRVADEEKELIQTGVPREKVRQYVADTVALSPVCLGRMNIQFLKLSRPPEPPAEVQ